MPQLYFQKIFLYPVKLRTVIPAINTETRNLDIDWDDEIIKGILLTKDKKIMNEEFI